MPRIVTVTLGPALDVSFVVERLVPDRKLRAPPPALAPGGGGLNVARAIRRLGGSALAMWLRGGTTGQRIAQLLDDEGVEHEAFAIDDETRMNVHIEERATGHAFRLNVPAAHVSLAEADALLARIAALDADYLVLSGSLPPGLPTDYYARLARSTRPETRVILDTSGPALRTGAAGGIFLVKPNGAELSELAGRRLDSAADRIEVARALVRQGQVENVATELGTDEGLLLVSATGVERIAVPSIETVSPVGAGDSTVAGLVLGLTRGMPLADAARFGAAAGAAAALTAGTELCRRRDVERIWTELAPGPRPGPRSGPRW